MLDDLVDTEPLEGAEHLVEQCGPVVEMPIEAALGYS
jgi:hypothetical protein